jgi:purine-nucleoside phosphorylase, family 1 (deoD)
MSTHINAKSGDIAKKILLPGDPMRAKFIAENYLDNPVCFNTVRGMLGFTGGYKGEIISVMGTGMGIPSISIYITELMTQYGVETLVRIGTCGSMQTDIKIKDVILAQSASTDSGFLHHIFPGNFAPTADFGLLKTAYEKAETLGIDARVGNILSSDMFYGEELVSKTELWIKYGVMGVEMEAAALYTLAKKHGCRALALLTVSDSIVSNEPEMSSEDREKTLDNMIRIALETVTDIK